MGNYEYKERPKSIADSLEKIKKEHCAEWDGKALDYFVSDHSGGANKMVDHVADVGNMVDHIPDAEKMVPLTLEQLREMDGKPVWIERIGSDSLEDKEWALVFCKEKFCRTSCGNIALFGCYGIGWLAYAYPPAHIDLEAWEPCGETCRNNCATCEHNADELFSDADYCKDCHRYSKWESSIHKYCERCGRPRTPEARAMLEKRLRG